MCQTKYFNRTYFVTDYITSDTFLYCSCIDIPNYEGITFTLVLYKDSISSPPLMRYYFNLKSNDDFIPFQNGHKYYIKVIATVKLLDLTQIQGIYFSFQDKRLQIIEEGKTLYFSKFVGKSDYVYYDVYKLRASSYIFLKIKGRVEVSYCGFISNELKLVGKDFKKKFKDYNYNCEKIINDN